jgi:TetR/AcrR family transcriptional repressor of nem operon
LTVATPAAEPIHDLFPHQPTANAGPLESAAELDQTSAVDASHFEAGENDLTDQGMGAFVKKLGAGVPVYTNSPVTLLTGCSAALGAEGNLVRSKPLHPLDYYCNLKRMRYPPERKAETHEKILAVAARSFREQGSDTNGIGEVMRKLGLTKGGFYRHFESKGDLYAKAVARAFEQMADRLVTLAEAAPAGHGLQAIIDFYLSTEHLDDPGTGCPLAALAPEIARQPRDVGKRINKAMQMYRDRLLPYVPGRNAKEKLGRFFVLFPGMAGVLVTARAIVDAKRREQVLSTARSFYVRTFAQESLG